MTEPLWTSQRIARATRGHRHGGPFEATGVSIDTRSLKPGDLFIALAGARDGHDFLDAAFKGGAAGAITSREIDHPCVVVEDTQNGLERLARSARLRARGCRRGAVTGSVGKTSVTRAIAAGLALAGRAHSSVKSYNNHIGVPLTLARMPRDTERAVFEIGMNHAGEIEPLSRLVRPHAVAITTVGPVHIENFADGEAGVARAKAEIFAGLRRGGTAVLNADDRWFGLLADAARERHAKVRGFGSAAGADARLIAFRPTAGGAEVEAEIHGERITYALRQTGAHWGPNSLCALLMLEALEVDRATALAALAGFEPLEGRGAEMVVRLKKGGAITLIDESYNANPVSMAATLKALGARPASGRRIVAITDMLELGENAPRYHADLLAGIVAAGVDQVFCAGPLMAALWNVLPPARRGGWAESAADLAPRLAAEVEPGDTVMVKGSNGSKASALAAALAALDIGVPKERRAKKRATA